jgi:surface protein
MKDELVNVYQRRYIVFDDFCKIPSQQVLVTVNLKMNPRQIFDPCHTTHQHDPPVGKNVVLINSFLYERLTDENFKLAIALWFENQGQYTFRFGLEDSRVTNMERTFYNRSAFNEDITRWNVNSVTNMEHMFRLASQFNQALAA